MIKGSISKIETLGLVDGPGIRTVVFLSGCKLRCKYCHNPEMWKLNDPNYTAEELVKKIIRYKPYYKRNNGGVTFSGGEPLMQSDFLLEVCKLLKKENIHITLDTSGVGNGNYEEILSYVDLVLFDIKHVTKEGYQDLTGHHIDESYKFIESLNKSNKPVIIRQVIVPSIMDNDNYLEGLKEELKKINNIIKIEFLPYHELALDKYKKLGIESPFEPLPVMDKNKCDELYNKFIKEINKG